MKMTYAEEKRYKECRKRFTKNGFDKREQFTKEWLGIYEEETTRARLRKSLEEDGIISVSCPYCSYPVYLIENDIQLIKQRKKKIHHFCTHCEKTEIARTAHLNTPYKNRIVDNMEYMNLELVGIGEREWQRGIRNAKRHASDIPDESKYDPRNKEMVEYVKKRAREELALVEARYRAATDTEKRWICAELAPYVYILDCDFSVEFHNCIRVYIGLPAETEKSYGLSIANKECTLLTPEQ